jgi:regulator of RNase E activity RraA
MSRVHHHRSHAIGLVPARPGQVTFGPAATIRFGPRRDDMPDHGLESAARHALADAPDGAVILLAAPDAPEEAVAGGKKLAALAEMGAAGVVAWGAIRDRAEAAAFTMDVWALGETPRASGDHLQVLETGGIVCFGGVTVQSGDWVYVDEAGLIVVPAADVEEVVVAAREIEEADAAAVRAIRGGGSAG